ncbi:MAG: histidine kinase [Butyrivibrio sp.]|uniref:sensor histidine kinase n=1 Tax=Butyrivibrio sp. TaxID=28121 RepID=UPI001B0B5010|nr:histidine kinase [Butyrivibrio sp.]MBO6241253.1 histidine kinase [Butyrivibrio sp.]
MFTLLECINFAITVIGLTISLLGIIIIWKIPYLDRRHTKLFMAIYTAIILCLFFSFFFQILYILHEAKNYRFHPSYLVLPFVAIFTLASLFMFLFEIKMGLSNYNLQKKEIAERTFRTKALQMRPHFIYNTLSNIYYLCELDPKKAQQVLDNFTTYLKNNFSSVVKTELIPFEEELQHTKAYLAVIKARYEDMIFVDYDTPYTSFKLPPLTLEPIVENAVKHGLDPEADPLYIMIHTRKEGTTSVLVVENTGIDFPFDDSPENMNFDLESDPHIGIFNIKSRLDTLCGGSLKITKRSSGGTVVTIKIPKC